MTYPDQFKHLIDLTADDVLMPDESLLAYAVCAYEDTACGWRGWIIESVTREQRQLPADTDQRCPRCNSLLFRTWATVRMEPSADQTRDLVEGRDYEAPVPKT